jgi:thiamine monophosphate kinase
MSQSRDPKKDPRPGDVVGTTGEYGKKAKCVGLITTETETSKEVKVLLMIALRTQDFKGEPHTRSLAQWQKLVENAEVLHVAE